MLRLLKRRSARANLLDFVLFTKPDYEVNWHHRAMCAKLDELVAGKIKRLIVCMPPRHGKCIAQGSLVLLGDGRMIPIENINRSDMVTSLDSVYDVISSRVASTSDNGEKPVLKITLQSGRFVVCTENHPLLTVLGWRDAGELKIGDSVAALKKLPIPEGKPLPFGFAALMGYLIGDGSYAKGAPIITASEPETVAHLQSIADYYEWRLCRDGEYGYHIRRKTKTGPPDGTSARERLREYMVPAKSINKRVPPCIFQANKEDLCAFLAAYFNCDGTANGHANGSAEFYSTSEGLLRDTQHLLTRLGIYSRLRVKKGRYKGAVHLSWRLTIEGQDLVALADELPVIGERGRKLREVALRCKGMAHYPEYESIPPGWKELRITGGNHGKRKGGNLRKELGIRVDKNYTRGTARHLVLMVAEYEKNEALRQVCKPSIIWDRIVNIEFLGDMPTYDIEVQDTHNFVVDNIVVHNSECVSRRLPAYVLGRNPDAQIIACSYGSDLASAMNRDVQRIIEAPEYQELFPQTKLNVSNVRTMTGSSLRNSDIFEIPGHKGMYKSAGVGSGITGRGCFVGETLVETKNGPIAISSLHLLYSPPEVLAYNHATGRLEYRKIIASRELQSDGLVEIITKSGRRFTCTEDHPVFTKEFGYRAAGLLDPGCSILTVKKRQATVPLLRRTDGQRQQVLPKVLLQSSLEQGEARLLMVQEGVRAPRLRASQSCSPRPERNLLLNRMLKAASCRKECASVHRLQGPDAGCAQQEILFCCVPGCVEARVCRAQKGAARPQAKGDLQALWSDGRVRQLSEAILHQGMRRFSSLGSNDRGRQLSFQNRDELRQVVRANEAVDFGEGRGRLRGVQKAGQAEDVGMVGANGYEVDITHPSHRRKPSEQYTRKLNSALLQVSQNSPHIEADEISVVRRLCERGVFVYDIQVDGLSNFFANEVLVHNCNFALIDDPVRNRADADSPTYREKLWEWYTSTFYTRLEKGASVLVVSTRWHEDDLVGRLLRLSKQDPTADQWEVISFPAIAEGTSIEGDPRKPGEPLWPNKYDLNALSKIKAALGSFEWASLYQQRPAPAAGGVFKTRWWKFWFWKNDPLPPVEIKLDTGERITCHVAARPSVFPEEAQSWDMTFKGLESAKGTPDYVVGQAWGRQGADSYLLDEVRGQWEFTETLEQFKAFTEKHPETRSKFVEAKANGPAIISTLGRQIPGLIPVEPDGDKVARARAITHAVEAGNVWLPHPSLAPWVWDFIYECATFPSGKNDDRVDAMTQILRKWTANFISDFEPVDDFEDSPLSPSASMGLY